MNTRFTFIFLLLFSITATAQKWTNFKSVDGLIDDYVYSITVDNQGNKWVGTNGGVSKFDGTNWTNFSKANSGFPGNAANAIAIDAQGNIWFGTDYGVSKFDGTNWTNYMASDYVSVSCIAIDTLGNLWIGATSGSKGNILKFDGTNWKSYFIDNLYPQITCIAIESKGNIWIGTTNGVSKFDGSNLTTYTTANSGLANDIVHSIVIDKQGNKLIATGGGVSKFDNTNWTSYPFYGLSAITIDNIGNIWVASTGYISKFDMDHWTTYYNPGSIAIQFMSIAIDSDGNKWLGSYGDGVFKFEDVSTGLQPERIIIKNENILSFSPNPSANETKIAFPHPDKYTLIISDINGKIVNYISEINGKETNLLTKGMKAGIYVASVTSITNNITYRGKIIVAK